MVPTVAQCFELMDEYRMLPNIRMHSLVVARVTECLVRSLQQLGHEISLEIAVAGALLHDIAKTQCLESAANHAREGWKICTRHRLDEIADIVGEHIRLAGGMAPEGYTEKEIVFYADKRVNHERIVSLDERLAYILDRYGRDNQARRRAILDNFEQCRQVEAKVFDPLDFGPDELGSHTHGLVSVFPELEK
ncbi:MAG: HD domain-containing protein [Desulfobacteraceae bacterium]|nr:HD domain-containing protein [Desulfobacteraceae bacterium]